MNVEAENAVMRERARIREALLAIEGEDLIVVTDDGTREDVLIQRSEVLKII